MGNCSSGTIEEQFFSQEKEEPFGEEGQAEAEKGITGMPYCSTFVLFLEGGKSGLPDGPRAAWKSSGLGGLMNLIVDHSTKYLVTIDI
jgi:hypothetical protein